MADLWIVNASPLIVLGKAACLRLLESQANRLIIPYAVATEVASGPRHDPVRQWLEAAGKALVAPHVTIPANIASFNLGAGESAVISEALERPGSEAILDDLAARRAAMARGVSVCGTLAVILRARQKGLISAAAPLFDLVEQAGLFISPGLRAQALSLVGE